MLYILYMLYIINVLNDEKYFLTIIFKKRIIDAIVH